MRRPRDVALRAGFYLAAALSGFAAAYVLREWVQHLWDARNPQRALSDRDDQKPDPHPSDEAPPTPVSSDTVHDPHTPSTKSLPPLRTHSLPPPLPSAHALLSGSFVSINDDTSTIFSGSSGEDGVDEEGAAQTNTSDSDSFVDVLSPAPTRVVSRRRSMRAHDLFAESHISFAELGSLVAPPNEPK